jgi:hypothetical protein
MKCGEGFENRAIVDGRERNLQRRKFCLKCSPFGTRMPRYWRDGDRVKQCRGCGKEIPVRRDFCNTCASAKRRDALRERLFEAIGDHCVACGYGGKEKIRILELHHLDPSTKLFDFCIHSLSVMRWDTVLAEAQKCVVLCPRCHREVYCGLLEGFGG